MTISKSQKPRVSFLFGSGISLELGLPSTADITEVILSGKQGLESEERFIYKDTTQSFYLCGKDDRQYQPMDEVSRQLVSLIVNFLNYCASYFSNSNYEQVYEIVYQIYCYLCDDNQNPNPFIKKFVNNMEPILAIQISHYNQTRNYSEEVRNLQELCFKSLYYIESIVNQLIFEGSSDLEKKDFSHFNWLDQSIKFFDVQQIATLNHDLVLETFLVLQRISYSTGFSISDRKSSIYQFNWQKKEKLPLLKLHGSLGWHIFKKNNGRQIIYRDTQKNKNLFNGFFEFNGNRDNSEEMQDWYSMKIMGTNSKPKKYARSIYLDLFHHFISYLSNSNLLIIIGYSFSDQAVNNYIYEQMLLNQELKIIVVSTDKEKIVINSQIFCLTNRVFFIEKAVLRSDGQSLVWNDIKDCIENK